MRILVDIPQHQVESLAVLAQQQDLARAELVRQAIAEYLQRHPPMITPIMEQAFGLWQQRDDIGDGLDYQNKLRDEWA